MHGLAPVRPGHLRTFPHISSTDRRSFATKDEHFRDFPVAAELALEDRARLASSRKQGDGAVLSSRAKTGFGGMITVAAVLLAAQLITGVQAFPL